MTVRRSLELYIINIELGQQNLGAATSRFRTALNLRRDFTDSVPESLVNKDLICQFDFGSRLKDLQLIAIGG